MVAFQRFSRTKLLYARLLQMVAFQRFSCTKLLYARVLQMVAFQSFSQPSCAMSWSCCATTTAVPTRRFRVCGWLWKSRGPTAIACTARVSWWSRTSTLGCRSKSQCCTAHFCVQLFSSLALHIFCLCSLLFTCLKVSVAYGRFCV